MQFQELQHDILFQFCFKWFMFNKIIEKLHKAKMTVCVVFHITDLLKSSSLHLTVLKAFGECYFYVPSSFFILHHSNITSIAIAIIEKIIIALTHGQVIKLTTLFVYYQCYLKNTNIGTKKKRSKADCSCIQYRVHRPFFNIYLLGKFFTQFTSLPIK